MKSFLCSVLGLFLLCSIALHGKTVQLAHEAEPLALVHGCVSMINGEFVQQKTDLYVEGPSSLTLTRVYGSGLPQIQSTLGYGFTWSVARDLWSVAGSSWDEAALDEREGIHLYYRRIPKADEVLFKVAPKTFLNGYTNYSPGEISGSNNLHNVTLRPEKCIRQSAWSEGGGWRYWLTDGGWTVTLGCGTKRIYTWAQHSGDRWWWTISKEIRPDGNRVLFDYDSQRNLNKMVLTDSTEQIELLSYTLQHKEDEITVLGSNSQEVHYAKGNFPFKLPHQLTQHFKRLAQVDGKHLIPTQYSYYKSTGGIAGKLESIQQPEGRQLRVEYYGDSRVHQLKAPIGSDDQLLPFATFTYGDQTRTWTGPEGEQTQYHLDDHQRIRAVQKYHEGSLYSQTGYWWNDKGEEAGNLMGIGLYDANSQFIQGKQFRYDSQGNTIYEVLEGNLTGRSASEGYATERTFLPIFNVVTEEKGGDGSRTTYRYKEGTNLLIAQLHGVQKNISRQFFEYDQFANLILEIKDNGSGLDHDDLTEVTVRTIRRIEPITTPPLASFWQTA